MKEKKGELYSVENDLTTRKELHARMNIPVETVQPTADCRQTREEGLMLLAYCPFRKYL